MNRFLFTTLWTDEGKISLIHAVSSIASPVSGTACIFNLTRSVILCAGGGNQAVGSLRTAARTVTNRDLLVAAVHLWAPRAGQMDGLICCMIRTEKKNAVHWSKPKSFYEVLWSQWVSQLEAHGQCKHSLFIAYACSALTFHMASPSYQACATLPKVTFKIKVIKPYCLLNWLRWRIDLLRLDMIILPPLFWHKHGNNCCFKVVNPSNMRLYFVLVRWQLYQYVFFDQAT